MTDERTPRDLETRDAEYDDSDNWVPPDNLPTPNPVEGWHFRWVRAAQLGQADNTNVSKRMREGYVPVKAADVPELMLVSDLDGRFGNQGGVEVGGLVLCKVPAEKLAARERYHANKANQQMAGVDHSLLRENDPRMPMDKLGDVIERTSRTSNFGTGE
jgi:hypothetical protein